MKIAGKHKMLRLDEKSDSCAIFPKTQLEVDFYLLQKPKRQPKVDQL